MQTESIVHTLSSGRRFTSPFQVPRLAGAMIFGTVDAIAAAELMTKEGWRPIRASSGDALACLWLSDFLDSTAGPYRELTVTLLVAKEPLELPWINAFTPLAAQLHPDAVVCEYVLLLDNSDAIDYGRELHGFDKQLGELDFHYGDGQFRFEVRQAGRLAVRGQFREQGLPAQPAALTGLVRAYGVLPTLRLLSARSHRMPVVTPRAVRQLRSDLYFSATALLQKWQPSDALVLGDSLVGRLLERLEFRPTCVERLIRGHGLMPLPLKD